MADQPVHDKPGVFIYRRGESCAFCSARLSFPASDGRCRAVLPHFEAAGGTAFGQLYGTYSCHEQQRTAGIPLPAQGEVPVKPAGTSTS